PQRFGVEDAGPVHEQLVRALAGDVGDDDALGVLVRGRKRVDVVARGGELDERHGGDARPVCAVMPAPLDARIPGVDGEDHAGLAESTRPLRTARTPSRVTSRTPPSSASPLATPPITRPSASRTRTPSPAAASIACPSPRAL